MPDRNQEIVDVLTDLVRLSTLDEGGPGSFRVRAYENAARELEEYRGDLESMTQAELTKIDGVGKSTAKKIREYFDTGKVEKLEALRAKYPPEFVELTRIPGLGPKTLLQLRAELGISNIDQLRLALDAKRLRELPGFGAKKEENLQRALERMAGLGKNKRRSVAETLPLALSIVSRLRALPSVENATYCGSLRRFRETIGDIDIVAVADDSAAVMDAFTSLDEVEEIVGKGETKSSVIVGGGLQVDLRVVTGNQYGAAILYFTGSKAHNIKLRQRAIARGWTLNEYGLCEADGGALVASATEDDIYRALELDFIPPPMREDHGEVEAAAGGNLVRSTVPDDVISDWWVPASELDTALSRASAAGLSYVVAHATASELDAVRQSAPASSDVDVVWAVSVAPGARAPDDVAADLFAVEVPSGAADDLTESVLASLQDPRIRALVGATGRHVGDESKASIDVERTASALSSGKQIWIVRCDLERLDPSAEMLRRIGGTAVTIALGSGPSLAAPAAKAYGPLLCQRAMLDASAVANGWSRDDVSGWLRG